MSLFVIDSKTEPDPVTDVVVNPNPKVGMLYEYPPIEWVQYQVTWDCLPVYVKERLKDDYAPDTDIIVKLKSDHESWMQLAGREGYGIVRDGMLTAIIVWTIIS
jgi:hypothetical protein